MQKLHANTSMPKNAAKNTRSPRQKNYKTRASHPSVSCAKMSSLISNDSKLSPTATATDENDSDSDSTSSQPFIIKSLYHEVAE